MALRPLYEVCPRRPIPLAPRRTRPARAEVRKPAMRLPRPRFTVRRLMIAVAVLACLLVPMIWLVRYLWPKPIPLQMTITWDVITGEVYVLEEHLPDGTVKKYDPPVKDGDQ